MKQTKSKNTEKAIPGNIEGTDSAEASKPAKAYQPPPVKVKRTVKRATLLKK